MEHKTNFFKTTAGQVVIIAICYAVTLEAVKNLVSMEVRLF